jgi:hypothetical protein
MQKKQKKIMSFYDFMMHFYLKDPDRYALAYNMKKLAPRHKELKEIDSLSDLMIASQCLTDPDARAAVTGSLWCEYCAVSGHEMT